MTVTAAVQEFRARVHDYGTTTPADGTVDFTWTVLGEYPSYGAQRIDVLSGQHTTSPWSLTVVDASDAFLTNMSSGGEMDLVSRIVEVQENRDSGGWSTVFTGRLTRVWQDHKRLKQFKVQVSDERWIESSADIFTASDTVSLYPAGAQGGFKGYFTAGAKPRRYAQAEVDHSSGQGYSIIVKQGPLISGKAVSWISDDMIPEPNAGPGGTSSNFTHTRAYLDGTAYPIVAFTRKKITDMTSRGMDPREGFDEFDPEEEVLVQFVINAGGALPAAANGEYYELQIKAVTAEPSDTNPVHIGIDDGGVSTYGLDFSAGETVWDIVTKIYDEIGVRYDQAAFDDLATAMPYRWQWRVTSPKNARQWLAENVYGPTLVVPFIDAQGRVAPRSVRVPSEDGTLDPSEVVAISTAFEFDSGNLIDAPSWEYASSVVSIVRAEYEPLRPNFNSTGYYTAANGGKAQKTAEWRSLDGDPNSDFLIGLDREHVEYTSDSQGDVGDLVRTFKFDGAWFKRGAGENAGGGFLEDTRAHLERDVEYIAKNVFARFGRGSITGTFRSLRLHPDGSARTPLDDVFPGDFVKLNVGTFPNPVTPAYGGTRVVQILSKNVDVRGVTWTYLDAGPDLQPLATPTVSIALTTSYGEHSVDITVGSVPSGAVGDVRVRVGANGYNWIETDKADGTFTLDNLPSGTEIGVRVQARQVNRIRSDWSAEDTVTTNSITAPTAGTATVDGLAIKFPWTNTNTQYRLQPLYKATADSTWLEGTITPLPPGSDYFVFIVPTASTSYDVGVRYVDEYGGASSTVYDTISSGSAKRTADDPTELRLPQARTSFTELPDPALVFGYGFEAAWASGDPDAWTEVQMSTLSNFSTVDQTFSFQPGVEQAYLLLNKLDDTTRYVRARHYGRHLAESGWTSTASAKPTGLIERPGADKFASGYAYLGVYADNTAQLNVGHGNDRDTHRAYYEVVVNPSPDDETAYPDVDDTDSYIDRANMPYTEVVDDPDNPGNDLVLAVGDIVLLRTRFWNKTAGFGQETTDRFVLGADAEQGRLALIDFRETERSDTQVKYEWTAGADTAWVYCYVNETVQPITSDPWGSGTLTQLEVGVDAQELTVDVPPPGYVTYIQFEPKDSTLALTGPVIQVIEGPLAEEPDTLTSITAEVNQEDGSVRVRVEGNSKVESYRYAYNVAAQSSPPSWPSDAEMEGGGTPTGQATRTMIGAVSVDDFSLSAATVGLGEMIRIRATGYINSDGTGTDGATDHGVTVSDEAERTKFRVPTMEITTVLEDTPSQGTARFGVTVHDPDGLADTLNVRTKAGEAAWSSFSVKSASPADATEYLTDVTMTAGHGGQVEYQLLYTLGGSQVTVPLVSPLFDYGRVPTISIIPHVDEDALTASATVIGDADWTNGELWIDASTSGFVADPKSAGVNIGDVGSDAMATPADIGSLLTGLGDGDIIYISAIGAGSTGLETAVKQAQTQFSIVAPALEITTITDGALAVLGVTVKDVSAQADNLYVAERVAGGGWGSWTLKSGTPADATEYTEDVVVNEGHTSAIKFRLQYTIRGRIKYTYAELEFDLGDIPDIVITPKIDASGNVSAVVTGDPDTKSVCILAKEGGYDTAANTRLETPIDGRVLGTADVGTLLTLTDGQTAFLTAFGYSAITGGGTESSELAKAEIGYNVPDGGDTGNFVRGITADFFFASAATLGVRINCEVGPDTDQLLVTYYDDADVLQTGTTQTGLSGGSVDFTLDDAGTVTYTIANDSDVWVLLEPRDSSGPFLGTVKQVKVNPIDANAVLGARVADQGAAATYAVQTVTAATGGGVDIDGTGKLCAKPEDFNVKSATSPTVGVAGAMWFKP